jgi:hypothetical protein
LKQSLKAMTTPSERKVIIKQWFKEFNEDEDQISLGIDEIQDGYLQLSCGTGFIIFSFGTAGEANDLIAISSKGNDKFVKDLVKRCNDAAYGDQSEADSYNSVLKTKYLKNVLTKFAEISKEMAVDSNRSVTIAAALLHGLQIDECSYSYGSHEDVME